MINQTGYKIVGEGVLNVGGIIINHFMYTDDMVIFSPCVAGLQQLLKTCSQYGQDYDIGFIHTAARTDPNPIFIYFLT